LTKKSLWLLLATALVALHCASNAPATVPAAPERVSVEDRILIDPRIGFDRPAPPKIDARFQQAWNAFEVGDNATARMRFDEIRKTNPDYLPAALGIAAIDIRDARFEHAKTIVDRALAKVTSYTAAEVYDAEIAARQGQLRHANDLYSVLAARPAAPEIVKERASDVRQRYFEELSATARAATGPEANRVLAEALAINPAARDLRMQLVHNLLAEKRYDEARIALDPLIGTEADRADVQEALAEIEVGRGQYEQAISRYQRLASREHDPRYATRLNQIKEDWSAANMPPQFRKALETDAITRADLAILLYWKVASIRFAQNLGAPPIATDIENVTGREEVVRAIAIGMLQVDPITRRVGPHAAVNAAALTRYAARVLANRGATCARGAAEASKIVAACNVTDLTTTQPLDSPVSGRQASGVIDEIDRALR
jgi:thioredoxin-like negative regulator of GroEL